MSRKQTKTLDSPIEPEEETQELPDEELGEESGAEARGPSKSKAARQAIDAGYEKPAEAVAYILETFGVDMKPQHFSAIKSNYRKKAGTSPVAGRADRPSRKGTPSIPAIEGIFTPPPKRQSDFEPDVLLALENVKELVEQYGADKVKRMVDLLG